MLVGKEAPVDIGKGGQIVVHVGVPVLRLCVQYPEQLDQGAAGGVLMPLQIVVEFSVAAKDLRVLGVQAEDQPDAQGVQALEGLRGLRVLVLL